MSGLLVCPPHPAIWNRLHEETKGAWAICDLRLFIPPPWSRQFHRNRGYEKPGHGGFFLTRPLRPWTMAANTSSAGSLHTRAAMAKKTRNILKQRDT